MIQVHIPYELRGLAGGSILEMEVNCVSQLFAELSLSHAQLACELQSMALAIDGDIINEPLLEPLAPGCEVIFMPRIAAG